MTDDRWLQVKEIFERALELGAADRSGLLDTACGDDDDLRTEVESLLLSHAEVGEFLSVPPRNLAAEVVDLEERGVLEGRSLGPYRVVRRVGRGGTGSVYLAARDDAEFHQRVAIKVIRRGMATVEMLERFRAERQILASIDHPNIARLLDGGSTEEGLPYFVMEYIEGEPIDQYSDNNQLTVAERLALFRTVCGAVQFAHQNLVVHRDLKPGNILVTAEGTPKLLDFGIAKLLNPELSGDARDPTVLELRVMTPEYASPEQIQGRSITTASDVYSLGVLLFQLLTGRRPVHLNHLSIAEMEREIQTTLPHRPSAVVERPAEVVSSDAAPAATPVQIAELRRVVPDRLRRQLAGDLDNIVMKALRKEPARRYASAEQLSEDLHRYQAGLPVRARPDTFSYRAGKFVRRHRLAVAVALTGFVLGLAFTATLAVQARRLATARDLAEHEAATARLVNDFLQQVLSAADPLEGMGRDVTVVESLVAAVPRIRETFSEQPEIEAAIRHTVGQTFLRLGRLDEAEAQLGEAVRIRRELHPDDHLEVAASVNGLGEVLFDRGDIDAAEVLYRESLEMRRRLLGEEHADVAYSLDNLANVLHDRGDLEEAESMYRQVLEARRRALGPDDPQVASSLSNIATVMHDLGRLDEAEELHRESVALSRRALGDSHPDLASGLNNLATLLHDKGDLEEAEPMYREALGMTRELLGERHPAYASGLENLGLLLHDLGQFEAAEGMYRESLAVSREVYGNDHPAVAFSFLNLALLHDEQEQWAQALPFYERAERIVRLTYDDDHPSVMETSMDHALCLARLGRFDDGEPLVLGALAGFASLDEYEFGDEIRRDLALRASQFYELWDRPEEADRYRRLAEPASAQ